MKLQTRVISIRVPEDLWKKAKKKAKGEKRSITNVVTRVLEDYVGSYTAIRTNGRKIQVSVPKDKD